MTSSSRPGAGTPSPPARVARLTRTASTAGTSGPSPISRGTTDASSSGLRRAASGAEPSAVRERSSANASQPFSPRRPHDRPDGPNSTALSGWPSVARRCPTLPTSVGTDPRRFSAASDPKSSTPSDRTPPRPRRRGLRIPQGADLRHDSVRPRTTEGHRPPPRSNRRYVRRLAAAASRRRGHRPGPCLGRRAGGHSGRSRRDPGRGSAPSC